MKNGIFVTGNKKLDKQIKIKFIRFNKENQKQNQ